MAVKSNFASGDVLTASDVNTYLTNGGLVYVNQTSFSATNLVTLDNIFTSTYTHYKAIVSITTASANGSVLLRMRTGGTTNTSSNYAWGGFISYAGSSILSATTSGGTATGWTVNEFDTTYYPNMPFVMEIMNPQASYRTCVFSNGWTPVNPQPYYRHLGGAMTVTTSYDGMALATTAGNITGTLTVYGYRIS